MRVEPGTDDLVTRVVADEPLIVVLPSDHRWARRKSIDPATLSGEPFIHVSNTAPALRAVIDAYLDRRAIATPHRHEADNLAMAISLVASTRGYALLPIYATDFLPWSVVGRPIKGVDVPTIPLVVAHHKANHSPTLQLFMSRIDELIARVAGKPR